MGKRSYVMTEDRIARFAREGRGTGEGAAYRPWLTTHDVPSLGRSRRMAGRRHLRIHHLLSDIESACFMEYDWRDDVVDVREQFPLDRGLTRAIAVAEGIAHPRDPRSGVDVVMTTDLLVSFRDGSLLAVACKYSGDLSKARVLEKLEIERLYWSRMERRWLIRTERGMSRTRFHNLGYLYETADADRRHWLPPGFWDVRSAAFLALLARTDPSAPFADFASRFDGLPGFAAGDAVSTMRYLAFRRLIRFDMEVKFDHSAPLGRSVSSPDSAARAAAA